MGRGAAGKRHYSTHIHMLAKQRGAAPAQVAEEIANASYQSRATPIRNLADIAERCKRIEAAYRDHDDEVGQTEEADLFRDLLEAIASGQLDADPKVAAEAAISGSEEAAESGASLL